jgi:putative two-component system response regulator
MVQPTIPLVNKRILIVEDNPSVRQLISRTLEIEGYSILQANDGAIALSILQKTTPDLILSDISLPNLNGVEFYKALYRERQWFTIPFIFIISTEAADQVKIAQELGVEDFLPKPIDTNNLVKIVSSRLLKASALQMALLDQAYLETVTVLANTIEGRDTTTSQHVERVANMARKLAKVLHWPAENLRILEFGARLHDIGKIIVPDHILNKPGPLTAEEWEIMKSHTLAGAKILREIKHLRGAIPFALYHHERWDGTGYPYGIKEREIPLEGRMLALVDVYDALTTNRPYRSAMTKQDAINYLKLQSAALFDPDLVPIFIEQVIDDHKA